MKFGDKEQKFLSLFSGGDNNDSPIGSFRTLNNVIPNRNWSSIKGRGAFVSDIDLPSVGNGLKTGQTLESILGWHRYRVTKPVEQEITILIGLVSWTPTGGTKTYMPVIFKNPAYTGSITSLYPTAGSFGAATTWRNMNDSLLYIDIVESGSKTVTRSSANKFTTTITAPSYGYLGADLAGGYIYIEDAANFTSPNLHAAEGDSIISHSDNDFNAGTNLLTLHTLNDHATMWNDTDHDVVRYHKNLELGKINYQDLCSTSATFFLCPEDGGNYTFSFLEIGEKLLISIHAGASGRASYTLQLDYINRKDFGVGAVFSRADYFYNAVSGSDDRLYDKHLVVGFPGYSYIIKNGSDTFTTKPITYYTGAPSAGGVPSATIGAGGYDAVSGRLDFTDIGAVGGLTNLLYRISGSGISGLGTQDLSITLNDFFISEFDVHGYFGSYTRFDAALPSSGALRYFAHPSDGAITNLPYYNRPEYTATVNLDGIPVATGETAWTNAYALHSTLMAVYDYRRAGLHSENTFQIGAASMALGMALTVPAHFNRTITGLDVCITGEKSTAISITKIVVATESKKIITENFEGASGWDFHLCFIDASSNVNTGFDGYRYVKVFRYDKRKEAQIGLGGSHLTVTGNPDYSRVSTSFYDQTVSLSLVGGFSNGYVFDNLIASFSGLQEAGYIAKDLSFGAKHLAFAKDILFAAGVLPSQIIGNQNYRQSEHPQDNFNLFYSGFGDRGGNYHLFDSGLRKWGCREIGDITGLAVANIPQGLYSATKQDQQYIVILAENGHKFLFLYEQTDPLATFDHNWSDAFAYGDCCIAEKSVVSEAGFVFCVGNLGVYMFQGSRKIDMTSEWAENGAYINDVWRAIDKADKQKAIGCFNRNEKWYQVVLPDGTIYTFDIRQQQIFTWNYAPLAVEPTNSATSMVFS